MSKRPNGEARGGSIPAVVCDRRATKPVGLLLINPEGGIAFGGRRRWLVAYSPLRGCARRAALPAAKSDGRRGPFNLGISSKPEQCSSELTQSRRGAKTQGKKMKNGFLTNAHLLVARLSELKSSLRLCALASLR